VRWCFGRAEADDGRGVLCPSARAGPDENDRRSDGEAAWQWHV
jgi:hypothetical protein